MSHPVIPAPVRFDPDGGRFALRSDTRIGYTAPEVAPLVERFCSQIRRRTGLRVAPMAGHPGPDEPAVRIELAIGDECRVLRAPLGLSPTGDGPADERHSLTIAADQVVLRAAEPVGVERGLTTFIQLLAATPSDDAGVVWMPGGRLLDAPRYAWRGLSLDLARSFFTLDEVRRVIDLLVLYKLNVLHVHLTDDQSWRLPVGRPTQSDELDAAYYSADFYRAEDLRALVAYAADRFVTVVPEVDMPGHVSALMRMHPELNSGRNEAEAPLGARWLDPELPATFTLVEDLLTGVAEIFPSPYIHIGGDEPWGMPRALYVSYVQWVRDLVRSMGKRPLGWQESARAGLGPDDVLQYWLSGIALTASLPAEVRAKIDADLALARRDVETAVEASVPVIVSPQGHCYLDVPYAEPSADPAQADRHGRVGLRLYSPMTVAQSFGWEPAEALGHGRAAQVAGVEAAIWAETISDFGDLSFLLLPRLPGVAHKAWSDRQAAGWTDHRDRLAWHGRLWAQDGLTYFRTSTVNWR
ncbi:MAG: family 20 glycosylhydrolase [Streptosporangiaceae bacterium]